LLGADRSDQRVWRRTIFRRAAQNGLAGGAIGARDDYSHARYSAGALAPSIAPKCDRTIGYCGIT
jgi:hypothetical protein